MAHSDMVHIFQSLQGKWNLQRKVSLGATMKGMAVFHKTNEKWLYHYQEEGFVDWNSKTYKAFNEYAYRYEYGKIMIHFWDKKKQQQGELLHILRGNTNACSFHSHSIYDCKQDKYHLDFVYESPARMQWSYQQLRPKSSLVFYYYVEKRLMWWQVALFGCSICPLSLTYRLEFTINPATFVRSRGSAREREISFAGGRTVYDNLDRGLFEPIPIFVDSLHHFILLDWRYLYQGSIRDFYPSSELVPTTRFQTYIESLEGLSEVQINQHINHIGEKVTMEQLKEKIDFAFLALHGLGGEDGSIQGLLTWYQIPYSGAGILGTALGIDKLVQKKWMQQAGFPVAPYRIIQKKDWQATADKSLFFDPLIQELGLPLVVKSPRQGSSIGVHIVREREVDVFSKAVHGSFGIEQITAAQWRSFSVEDKTQWMTKLIDLRYGIGFPLQIDHEVFYAPQALLNYLDTYFAAHTDVRDLVGFQGEQEIIIEAFITGREFSCIVLQEAGAEPVALPPTEMLKGDLHFDYRAKYLPGLISKQTPMDLPLAQLKSVQDACVALFKSLSFQVYARIDGILSIDQQIFLNDPNTTAGMNPSSFLFHQAAEIGLNPSQLLTFVIRNSLATRMHDPITNGKAVGLLDQVDGYLSSKEADSMA
eukprot:gene3017-3769_t